MPVDADEAELVALARRGDHLAFAELLRRHDDMMRAVAYRHLGSRDRMDDALQDAYLKAFRALDAFDGRAKFSTWLYTIVQRTCVDAIRKSKRRAESSLELVSDALPDAKRPDAPTTDRVDNVDELTTAIRALPTDQAAVVLLVDGEGLSYDEVADIVGMKPGTVASRLSRGRARLRSLLTEGGAS